MRNCHFKIGDMVRIKEQMVRQRGFTEIYRVEEVSLQFDNLHWAIRLSEAPDGSPWVWENSAENIGGPW